MAHTSFANKARFLRRSGEVSSNQVDCLRSVKSSVPDGDSANLGRLKKEYWTQKSHPDNFLIDPMGLSLSIAFRLLSASTARALLNRVSPSVS